MTLQETANGFPAGDFVSMLKNGDYQGALITALEVDQGGPVEMLIQSGRRTLEKAFGYVIELFERQRNHSAAKIQAMKTGRKCGRVIVGFSHE